MSEVLFNGTSGRIQGWMKKQDDRNAPVVLILPPHAKFKDDGAENLMYMLFKTFFLSGFTVLRINYRGMGKSKSLVKTTNNEINDAAMSLDWLQNQFPTSRSFWVAGISFGAWVGMQLLMRRPEIDTFVSLSPPAQLYDFSFLTPCPIPGMFIHGTQDSIIPVSTVDFLISKMRVHKGVEVKYIKIDGANHFFEGHLDEIEKILVEYNTQNMKKSAQKVAI